MFRDSGGSLGFRVPAFGLGFGVWGLGFGCQGQGAGFRVSGFGFRVSGLGFRNGGWGVLRTGLKESRVHPHLRSHASGLFQESRVLATPIGS